MFDIGHINERKQNYCIVDKASFSVLNSHFVLKNVLFCSNLHIVFFFFPKVRTRTSAYFRAKCNSQRKSVYIQVVLIFGWFFQQFAWQTKFEYTRPWFAFYFSEINFMQVAKIIENGAKTTMTKQASFSSDKETLLFL